MNTSPVACLLLASVTGICLLGCSRSEHRTGAPTIVQLHLIYEKTGGFRGGLLDRMEIMYPTPEEKPRGDMSVISEDQAKRIVAVIEDESVLSWQSMAKPPGIEDVFVYSLSVDLKGKRNTVTVYGDPAHPRPAEQMEALVRRLRALFK